MDIKQGIDKALRIGARYETKDGRMIIASRPADVTAEMITDGWKGVSKMDAHDFRKLGYTIELAQYVGGVRKTGRFCEVVFIREAK